MGINPVKTSRDLHWHYRSGTVKGSMPISSQRTLMNINYFSIIRLRKKDCKIMDIFVVKEYRLGIYVIGFLTLCFGLVYSCFKWLDKDKNLSNVRIKEEQILPMYSRWSIMCSKKKNLSCDPANSSLSNCSITIFN